MNKLYSNWPVIGSLEMFSQESNVGFLESLQKPT